VPGLQSGWAIVAYSTCPLAASTGMVAHNGFCCWFSITLLVLAVRELRRGPRGWAVAVCPGAATIAVGVFVQTSAITIAMLAVMAGACPAGVDQLAQGDRFAPESYFVLFAAIAAMPLPAELLRRIGFDRPSRVRRRLLPLWTDLTAACPQIVHVAPADIAARRSRYRLHRTVVEIRDYRLILSRHAGRRHGRLTREFHVPPHGQRALPLALAWTSRCNGEPPAADGGAQQAVAAELLDDAEELCRVAAHWRVTKDYAAILLDHDDVAV
jgi:hypothetical protein